jgi:Tfp pilus assembly protein PilF
MAPEQLDWSQHDVDTRADVYGLGVLLYELLAGSRPFDVTALRQVGLVEAVRILREQDAAPPSVRLAAAGPRLAALAQARAIDPRGLCRRVRGDLDWITLRALAKDRERRYASAAELAADIARHLANEPVSARAPSLAYRGGRFVKRHKAGVAAGAIVLVALVGGTAAATIGLVRARRAEQRARVEARTAGEVTKYLVNTFRLAEPEQARGAAVTAREILDAQERTIRGALAGDPGVQGRVMRAMGEAYGGLGLYDRALALLEEAVPRIEAAYGPGSEFLYDALNEFGNVANQAGDHAAARRAFERALAAATQALGDKHPNRALILGNLGSACLELGDLNAARQHLETALALNQENHGKASGAVARTLASLAQLEIRAGRPGEAVALAERSLEIRRQRFAPGEPALGHGHFMLGEALLAANRRAEAAVQYAAALPIWESAYGTSHALVGECLFGLAQARAGGGATPAERAVAYALYLRARTIVEAAFPKENPRLAAQRASWFERYVPFLFAVGREAEARQTAEAAAALRAAGKQAGATE